MNCANLKKEERNRRKKDTERGVQEEVRRYDLRHLKWQLITQRGLSPKGAEARIKQIMEAEHIDKKFNRKLDKKEKPSFKEAFQELKDAKTTKT